MAGTRQVVNSEEIFDKLSQLNAANFTSIAYISAAEIVNAPKKRKNPATNRMVSYPDYDRVGETFGVAGYDIAGVIKLSRMTFNWSNSGERYNKFKQDLDNLKSTFMPDWKTGTKKQPIEKVGYGDNGVSVYNGSREDLQGHAYLPMQNVYNTRPIVKYYLIGHDGNILHGPIEASAMKEFLKKSEISGVATLRKMQADEATIQRYIEEYKKLGYIPHRFEISSLLALCATIKQTQDSFVFINDKLTDTIGKSKIKINPAEFQDIIKDAYQDVINANKQEMMNESKKRNRVQITESELKNIVSSMVKEHLNRINEDSDYDKSNAVFENGDIFVDLLERCGWSYIACQDVGNGYVRFVVTPNAHAISFDELVNKVIAKLGDVRTGTATHRYAPEIKYNTIIIPDSL